MYIIQEIQADHQNHVALLPAVTKETREEAESAFYMICGAAVISSVPVHTVMVYTHEGFPVPELTKCFRHAVPESVE